MKTIRLSQRNWEIMRNIKVGHGKRNMDEVFSMLWSELVRRAGIEVLYERMKNGGN